MRARFRHGHGDPHGGGIPRGLRPGMIRNRHQQGNGVFGAQMLFHDAPLKHLRKRIRRDQTEPFQPRVVSCQKLGGKIPPIHDEIGAFVHMRMRRPKRLTHSLRPSARECPCRQ